MATYEKWNISPDWQSPFSEERRGGTVKRYSPDTLLGAENRPSPEVMETVGSVEARLARFGQRVRSRPLGMLYATLLKSESISSSLIEGYRTSPRDVLMAEFAPGLAGRDAVTIHRNVLAIETALAGLVGEWSLDAVDQVHSVLLPEWDPGLRRGQVRIGGRSLFRAAYIPPAQTAVPALMDDLIDYANRGGESVVVKAALIHAQFETIHPYDDGNGRTGRALVHAIFARAGFLEGAVIPVSTVLKVRQSEYIAALTAYRYDSAIGQSRQAAIDGFVSVFAEAVNDSITLADQVYDDVANVEAGWTEKLTAIRTDSVAHRIVDSLPDHPIVTAEHVVQNFGANKVAAYRAIRKLVDLGILKEAQGKYKRSSVFLAPDMIDLMVDAERRSASPAMDTLVAQPVLQAPAPSQPFSIMCGALMPRANTNCILARGHVGPHKSRR